jgi:hypothetical protein
MPNPEQHGEGAQQLLEHGVRGCCGEVVAANINAFNDQVMLLIHAILHRM